MLIGIPKEIKNHEHRVGMTPGSVSELIRLGHRVFVERSAGMGISISDHDYAKVGADILSDADEVFKRADMIVKVKEPQPSERAKLRPEQILFTYLHLAPDPELTKDLVDSGAVCIAYETITSDSGTLPLLAPMSEVAGRMSIQAGAHALEKEKGGCGLLLGGVAGVEPAKVTIIGGGVVGANAAEMAIGLGADVVVLDRDIDALRRLSMQFGSRLKTVYSNATHLEQYVLQADLVIGCVLVPGAAAPKLITAEMVRKMKPGSAIVDVAIDQGGCAETAHATTHKDPTYIVDGVVHYCVANMPGAVARTSTLALNNATLPYIIKLAEYGYKAALKSDQHFMNGLNVCQGKVTCKNVADSLGYAHTDPKILIN